LIAYFLCALAQDVKIPEECIQQVNNCSGCQKGIDVAFVVDFSASINVQEMQYIRIFMDKFVDRFKVGKHGLDISITHFWTHTFTNLTFSTKNTLEVVKKGIADFKCCIPETIQNLKKACCGSHGGTSISSGIRHGADRLARFGRRGVSKVMVVLTDGFHNSPYNRLLNRGNGGCLTTTQCRNDMKYALSYVQRTSPDTTVISVGIGNQNKYYLLEIADRVKGRYIRVATHQDLTKDEIVEQISDLACKSAPGGKCQAQFSEQQELVPPPKTSAPIASFFPQSRNNDRYFPYTSYSENWDSIFADIQSLPLKAMRFDPTNLILMIEQRTTIPYIVIDVLTGLDVRTGDIVWGPTETNRVHSRYLGIWNGHAIYIGRVLPPYYILKTQNIYKDARYEIYAVNTSTGLVTGSTRLPFNQYNDNNQENSQICLSSLGSTIFILEDDSLIIYGIGINNGKVEINLVSNKRGYPKAWQTARGDDTLDTCAILDFDGMGYIGTPPGPDKRERLFKVSNSGKMVWGDLPDNFIPNGRQTFSEISAFPNSTALIGGNGFYMSVDSNGKGTIHTNRLITGRYGTFVIGTDSYGVVSYSGNRFAPQDAIAPTNFQPLPIVHEKNNVFIMFAKKGTGGRIYDMDGRRYFKVPLAWEYIDFDQRTFFDDALFTLSYETIRGYPFNEYLELSSIPLTADDFDDTKPRDGGK
jgi:hypothetical protein